MTRRPLWVGALLLAACGGEAEAPRSAADAPAGPAAAGAREGFGAYPHANLVIVSLDTLRADATSVGGGPADISPTLAAFAQEAVLFEHARAQAPHTAPSHMSLFTSTLPSVHGVQNVSFRQEEADGPDGTDGEGGSKAIIVPARPDVPTLAEVLKAAGFRTVGLTDGGNMNPPHGLGRGFDEYTYDLQGVEAKVALGRQRIASLAAQDAGRFFLFWHTYQVHAPYCPPEAYVQRWAPAGYQGVMRERIAALAGLDFKERFSRMKTLFWKDRDTFGEPEAAFLRGLYDGGVRYTDDQLAGLFQALRDAGVWDTSIVVVLADHGEEFHEHGRWQHEQLFEECLRVPLLVRLPDGRSGGTRLRTPVALMDVMPTVLDLLGVDPETLQLPGRVRHGGRSLAAPILAAREPKAVPVFSELIDDRAKGGNFERLVAVYANGWKFIRDNVRAEKNADGSARKRPDGSIVFERHLFDLGKDPGEARSLTDQPAAAEVQASFEKSLLPTYEVMVQIEKATDTEREQEEMTPEMLEQLEQLGYAEGERPR